MKIIAHAGPMKTGSTAIQVVLGRSREMMLKDGITYSSFGALKFDVEERLTQDLEQLDTETLLISSEFLCTNKQFLDACRSLNAEMHAILVHRPLTETYKSLYLQNLKGPMARTTDFKTFVSEQEVYDRNPAKIGRTIYNYAALNSRMEKAGFTTHWLRYSRAELITRFCELLRKLSGAPLSDLVLEMPKTIENKISPLRSLHMGTAELSVEINKCFKAGLIPDETRKHMLGMLLDLSGKLKTSDTDYMGEELIERIRRIDNEIDASFYAQFLPFESAQCLSC